MPRIPRQALTLAAVLVLLAGAAIMLNREPQTRQVTAYFDRAVSIYVGTEVRVLGVRIGEVTDVVPEGDSVRVEMEYDEKYQIPADAEAVIITPTLVADRFVQLSPVYTGGEVMADGAQIPLQQTGSPIELDRIYQSMSTLANALGPRGANSNGALDELITAGARSLRGRGELANQMIVDLAKAADTFGNNAGGLFSTVRQLDTFTRTLADNDAVVRRFVADLGRASAQLSGERAEIEEMLVALATSIDTVRAFVRDNRGELVGRLQEITDVLNELVKEKDSLALALEKGPLGASNLHVAFDSKTGSIGSRVNVKGNVEDLDGFLCATVQNAGIPDADLACELFAQLLQPGTKQTPTGSARGPGAAPGGKQRSAGQPPDPRLLGEIEPADSLDELLGGVR